MDETSAEILSTKINNSKQYLLSDFAEVQSVYDALIVIADSETLWEIYSHVE